MRKKPKMILFDYGHTLLYENKHDTKRGNQVIWNYVQSNPKRISFEEFDRTMQETWERLSKFRTGMDINEDDFLRLVLDYLNIGLSVSLEEAEQLIWRGISEGKIMPKADRVIDYLNENGIRMAVISNLCWSSRALRERLDRLLPANRFEFVITSGEYIVKKPDRMLFEIALNKAGLSAADVWYCGDSIAADVYGAHGAGIFPVLYEGETDEPNPFEGQNDGYGLPIAHLRITDWDGLIGALERIQ